MSSNLIEKLLHTLHLQSKEAGTQLVYESVRERMLEMKGRKISESTFYNKINSDNDRNELNAIEFLCILIELKRHNLHIAVLEDFMRLFDLRIDYVSELEPSQDCDYKTVIDAWMSFDKEHGDVQSVLSESLKDSIITPYELDIIKKELAEQIHAMTKLRTTLDSVCGKALL